MASGDADAVNLFISFSTFWRNFGRPIVSTRISLIRTPNEVFSGDIGNGSPILTWESLLELKPGVK